MSQKKENQSGETGVPGLIENFEQLNRSLPESISITHDFLYFATLCQDLYGQTRKRIRSIVMAVCFLGVISGAVIFVAMVSSVLVHLLN